MIRIYGETPELEIENNADIQDVIDAMEELDEVYKQRSSKNQEYLTVKRDTLYTSFLYVIDNLTQNNQYVIEEVINLWDKFDSEQKDTILDKLFVQLDNIADERIHTWYENTSQLHIKIQKRYQQYLHDTLQHLHLLNQQ